MTNSETTLQDDIKMMEKIAHDLRSFNPYFMEMALEIIVLDRSEPGYDMLDEMVEICGVDRELWHKDQGHWVLTHFNA